MHKELEQKILHGVDAVLDSICTWHMCSDCPLHKSVYTTHEEDGGMKVHSYECLSFLFTRVVIHNVGGNI